MIRTPKFTVVVPTRQRADVLGPALRTVVAQDYDNLEILVSDNCSDDHTADVVKSFDDPRIRYVNTGQRMSMSHNWEFALSHIAGGWVTVLGDDDGLLPGALHRVAEIIDHYQVSMVRSSIASYIWPSLTQTDFGRLSVSVRKGCELRNSNKWLTRLINGEVSYSALPTLYTGGFVDHQLIERARDTAGKFYRSMVPDVYSSVVFSRLTENYVYCHEQFAVGGASKHSTGASQFSTGKSSDTDASPADKYYSEPNIPFHTDLSISEGAPPPPSIQLLVYESLLQSGHLSMPDEPHFDHQQQLEIVLRNAKRRHRAELVEWGQSFAKRHNIDFESVRHRSSKINYREKIAKNGRKLVEQLNTIDLSGSNELPILDVYEASIVAAAIKKVRPGMVSRAARRFLP